MAGEDQYDELLGDRGKLLLEIRDLSHQAVIETRAYTGRLDVLEQISRETIESVNQLSVNQAAFTVVQESSCDRLGSLERKLTGNGNPSVDVRFARLESHADNTDKTIERIEKQHSKRWKTKTKIWIALIGCSGVLGSALIGTHCMGIF